MTGPLPRKRLRRYSSKKGVNVKLARDEVILATDGVIVQRGENFWFTGASIDSRTVKPGELFFAIKGGKRNGHEFAVHAVRSGAAGVVASEEVPLTDFPHASLIRVTDTTRALGDLAGAMLKKAAVKVVGITGSCGKTTTKEMTAALLKGSYKVHASFGNLNNVYGLPLSVLAMPEGANLVVLEMGMSKKGEIERLTEIAPLEIAVITNISGVHMENFRSIREVASAKKEIVAGLISSGSIVTNGDDPWCLRISRRKDCERYLFGEGADCHLRLRAADLLSLKETRLSVSGKKPLAFKGKKEIKLKMFGRHNAANFVAAATVAEILGVKIDTIAKRASRIKAEAGRGAVFKFRPGFVVVDETYNANPAAMEFVLRALGRVPSTGRRIAVLGDMLELGSAAKKRHREVGGMVAKLRFDRLITVGPLAQSIQKGAIAAGMKRDKAQWVPDVSSAAEILIGDLKKGDTVVLKASHGMELHRAIEKLCEAFPRYTC